MFSKKRQLIAAAALACAIGFVAIPARADDASNTAMQQKIDQLEAKVEALEAQNQKPAATAAPATNPAPNATATAAPATSDEGDAIKQVLSQGDQKEKLMDTGGVNTGWDPANGFHIGSDDGNFYMHPWSLFQFEGVMNYRASVVPTDVGEVGQKGTMWQTGFDIRRMEIGANGHLWSPDFQYFVSLYAGEASGTPRLDDAYVTDRIGGSNFTFKGGQFVDPVWHEDNVSDGDQLAIDRSLVNAEIGGSIVTAAGLAATSGPGFDVERVQGIGVQFQQGFFHGEFDVHDGYNSVNTSFVDTAGLAVAPKPENFGVSGRAEFKILGDDDAWKEYSHFSAMNDKEDVLVAGTGAEWTDAGDENDFFYTFDSQWDTAWGLGVYGAIYGFNDNIPKAVAVGGNPALAGHFLNSGFLAQAGYMLGKQWEPYVRWDLTHLDGKLSPQQHTTNEFTLGINYYLYGQRAKFSLDGTLLPSGPPNDADSLGILSDQRHHEVMVRGQFQLEI